MDVVAPRLREVKKQAARSAMRRAALELVAERGLANVTVDDIAARAGVSPRTFFNYFASKEVSVFVLDPSLIEETVAHLRGLPEQLNAFAAMRVVMTDLVSSIEDGPDDVHLRRAVIAREPTLLANLVAFNTELEKSLVAAVRTRSNAAAARDGYAELLVSACLIAARTAFHLWSTESSGCSLGSIYSAQLDILERGLAHP